jgi:hypothetical protein
VKVALVFPSVCLPACVHKNFNICELSRVCICINALLKIKEKPESQMRVRIKKKTATQWSFHTAKREEKTCNGKMNISLGAKAGRSWLPGLEAGPGFHHDDRRGQKADKKKLD